MISNIIYSFNLVIWPKHIFFFAKTAFFGFQSSELYFFFIFLFFNDFFCLNGFKNHPTSVDKDKLRKSTNSKGLCLSTWVMSMLIGQILHCREAEGWTVSNHAHTNVSKEKVKSLFLIKHLTPEKRDTPLFFFSRSEFDDLREKQVTQNVTTFFISFLSFAEFVYSYEVRCMIWIKKNYVHATMTKNNNCNASLCPRGTYSLVCRCD